MHLVYFFSIIFHLIRLTHEPTTAHLGCHGLSQLSVPSGWTGSFLVYSLLCTHSCVPSAIRHSAIVCVTITTRKISCLWWEMCMCATGQWLVWHFHSDLCKTRGKEWKQIHCFKQLLNKQWRYQANMLLFQINCKINILNTSNLKHNCCTTWHYYFFLSVEVQFKLVFKIRKQKFSWYLMHIVSVFHSPLWQPIYSVLRGLQGDRVHTERTEACQPGHTMRQAC